MKGDCLWSRCKAAGMQEYLPQHTHIHTHVRAHTHKMSPKRFDRCVTVGMWMGANYIYNVKRGAEISFSIIMWKLIARKC